MFDFLLSYSNLFFLMGINALLALSVYITLKAGLLTMGHAGFMAIGAYVSSLLSIHTGMPFILNVIAAMILAWIIGILIGFPILKLHGVYLAIGTVAFTELVRFVVMNMKITRGALGLTGIPKDSTILHVLIALCLIIYFFIVYEKSQFGRTLIAIGEDETAARALGIKVTFHKVFAFSTGAAIAGLAGAISSHYTYIISPKEYGFHMAVTILLFTLFGGVRNIWGPILGAIILTSLPEIFRWLGDFRLLIYGTSLLIIVLFLPKGIIEIFYRRKEQKLNKKVVEEQQYVGS
ncbi:branched-chain amino acid ABC transporter permease [Bacillus sp. 1P10SD]|uniref:branched-chain amino acid ABC transporter permease n=1 Tax=Bacillus sp. 1P10SD TaxID=3132265 RepID=UPI0039A5713B